MQFGFSAFEDNNFVAFESESSISSVVLSDESGALAVHGVGANERAFDQLAFAAPPVWAESNKLTVTEPWAKKIAFPVFIGLSGREEGKSG